MNCLSWPDWVAFGLGVGQALRIVAAASSVTVEVAVPSNSGAQLPKLNVEGSMPFTRFDSSTSSGVPYCSGG